MLLYTRFRKKRNGVFIKDAFRARKKGESKELLKVLSFIIQLVVESRENFF